MADESSTTGPVTAPAPGRPDATGRRRAGGGGRRRAAPTPRRKGLRAVAWALAAAVLLGGAGFGYLWFKLNGNLKGVDINAALGQDRPENADDGSMDILLLGSDSRKGANGKYGSDASGARSDTAMILHVYKGRKKASVVSIPRDTLVERPACEKTEGGTAPAAPQAMFNEAYRTGGQACTVKTVEAMSGIRMDHFLEVDFTGFKKLIDELGGVDITTNKAIDDPESHLDLPPGPHTLGGEEALGLVRTRHAVGDGSDLGRIQLQQAFVKALIDQVKDVDLFSDPARLYDLADTATKTVTTDSELASVNDLLSFSKGLKNIGSENTHMVTLPVRYDPADPNRVLPMEKKNRQVWDALKHDRPIPPSATEDSAGDQAKKDTSGVVADS